MSESPEPLPKLSRNGHALHCVRCLSGLPSSQTEMDASRRLALVFYCLGSLDLLGVLESKSTDSDRESWREWVWEQQATGKYGTGFRPSPFMTGAGSKPVCPLPPPPRWGTYSDYDTPHLIMTYTALLSLSILHDDFSSLDHPGLLKFLYHCQRSDGSFCSFPNSTESDLRSVYCAFAISSMLDDWSGIDVPRALAFIGRCRTYEGGYGQEPYAEAQGGTTYCALAAIHLVLSSHSIPSSPLTPAQRAQTIRWLVHNQHASGGFRGRTEKDPDACYCFWCGASLQILGVKALVDSGPLTQFLAKCQFKFGGIAKAPGEHSDPFHTYLSLAALGIYPPAVPEESWKFDSLDPLLNAREDTARWAWSKIPLKARGRTS
ncbi:terpenoid cyclases/Protein prenyltransferase [Neolentinus lepideus HHB14362 ss-1]|uniref:Terpenoid cyclases/Protein prenyltransferase n=1 Tax=Neolentinus lepideus HHB14362 ss-1 TaxID=1314782 RepID=A0A165UV27_9AGAM|nr:terpenoid cyclases/Protein prenyltransferase [Neolentinus lepideus HHB14362 ss-1]